MESIERQSAISPFSSGHGCVRDFPLDWAARGERLSLGLHEEGPGATTPIGDATYPVTSEPDKTPGGVRPHGLVQVLKAGAIYFLVAVGAEFVLEVVRFQVVALHVNERLAEMLEIPNVLLATIIGARWVVDRFTLPPLPGIRLGVGLVALCLTLISEWTVIQALQSLSVEGYLTSQDAAVGTIPIGALGVLTAMPFLVGYRWER